MSNSSIVVLLGKDGKLPAQARIAMAQSKSCPHLTKYGFGMRTVTGIMVSPQYKFCNN